MRTRCRICHRVERWSADGSRTVELVGGRRRSRAPERDAFEVLAKSVTGEIGPVVAECPACSGPMVSEDGGKRIPWTIETPRGPIVFGPTATVASPEGPSLDAARALMGAVYPRPLDPSAALTSTFGSSLMVMMMAPVAVWLLAVFFVVLFLTHVGNPVPGP